MKSLKECIIESLLDDEDEVFDSAKEGIVKEFLEENYKILGSYTIKEIKDKFIVNVEGTALVVNKNIISLTNGLFEFGEVSRGFICVDCNLLTTLEGAPKKTGSDFNCAGCESLTTLEGAPKKVGRSFYCSACESLMSLEGAPKEVGKNFICSFCDSLKSLKGAPKEVGQSFYCRKCKSLKTLKGAPKEVGGSFHCGGCGTKFTEEDVRKYTNVPGVIWM